MAVLLIFGVALMLPGVAARIEAPLSRLSRFGPEDRRRRLRLGLLVGGALGFVYTPCAGPILAAVVSVSAASGRTLPVAVAYAAGSAVVLLALALGGRSCSARGSAAPAMARALQRTLAAIMIVTGIAIVTNLDLTFTKFVAKDIPNVNLTAGLECSSAVTGRLHEITGHEPKFKPANGTSSCSSSSSSVKVVAPGASQSTLLAAAHSLPVLGTAPEFTETEDWFNTPERKPLSLTGLKGRVVLVDFWTYTCINCIRTLPYLKAWDTAYRKDGLTIVGVETPEFGFENDANNVRDAIGQFGLRYPVVQDNEMGTWNAYGNQYWPADYLIDADGHVRYAAFGEGDYAKTETAIRALLAEEGGRVGGRGHPPDVVVPSSQATPETYIGTARAEGWLHAAESRPAQLRRACHRRNDAQSVRLQRHLEDLEPAGDGNLERWDRRRVPGQERLPRAELRWRKPAPGAGSARRQADLRARGGSRRPRQRRHGARPAPVHARLAAALRAGAPHAALCPGHHGLRLHLRIRTRLRNRSISISPTKSAATISYPRGESLCACRALGSVGAHHDVSVL